MSLLLAIVDDHPVVIEGLKSLLQAEPDVTVAAFGRAADLLAFLPRQAVDLVLLDLNLPDIHGIELCELLQAQHPTLPLLAISNHAERSMILKTLQSGAAGYILKNANASELLVCIHDALRGKLAVSAEVQSILAKPGGAAPVAKSLPHLTRREKEILHYLAVGTTTNEMARKLFLSPLTIETHRRNLLQKFEVKNVAALMSAAAAYNLLQQRPE